MSDVEESFVTLDQLPNDPLRMPPPYWRSGGGIFHIQRSLEDIAEDLLPRLVAALQDFEPPVGETSPEEGVDSDDGPLEDDVESMDDFPDELNELMNVEFEIIRLADLAIFMAAVEAESVINMVAVFNIHKDAAEAIEKLSPPDKLILLTALLGAPPVKGRREFESIRELTTWRNAAAHGHCVDQSTSSLRRNHLIAPRELPTIPVKLIELQDRIEDYLRVHDYLRGISKNPYTAGSSWDDAEIRRFLVEITKFKFSNVRGQVYVVAPDDK